MSYNAPVPNNIASEFHLKVNTLFKRLFISFNLMTFCIIVKKGAREIMIKRVFMLLCGRRRTRNLDKMRNGQYEQVCNSWKKKFDW